MGKTYLQGETLTAADLNASLSEAVNTSGYFVFAGKPGDLYLTGEHVHNARLTANAEFVVNTSPSYFLSVTNFQNSIVSSNTITTTSSISDQIGNVRQVPIGIVPTSPYTLVSSDAGKTLSMNGGTIVIPANIFTAGDNVTIFNRSTTAGAAITQGAGLTMYWAGQTAATSGNRTMTLLALSTILFTSATTAVITGAGLS